MYNTDWIRTLTFVHGEDIYEIELCGPRILHIWYYPDGATTPEITSFEELPTEIVQRLLEEEL